MKTKRRGDPALVESKWRRESADSKWYRRKDTSTRGWGRDRQRHISRSLGLMAAGLKDVSRRRCCSGGHPGGGVRISGSGSG